ncbi:hypothetical protein K2173_001219 [Erythroxylum novogranatense]|uniref:Seipin-2-like n=1 Tax=Erythroxylum novogranatense TaxID=1862640 RepID=A0AAV8T4H7_9ROSI|nr:hypothetical protein K2173_001219 [Erythroxylum novogranatense]
MELSTQSDEDDSFHDALDDFPFQDCSVSDTVQCDRSTFRSSLTVTASPFPELSSSLRRRSISDNRYKFINKDLKENEKNLESPESIETSQDVVDSSGTVSCATELGDVEKQESTITNSKGNVIDGPIDSVAEPLDSNSSNLLVLIAGLVINAIGFQINLFFSFLSFPIVVLYYSCMFIVDPFGAIRHVRRLCFRKLVNLGGLIGRILGPLLHDLLKDHKTIWKLVLRIGWGCMWSVYVCIILCGLLVLSVVIGALCMRYLVEEPMQIKEDLNFDYTKISPVAYVPIISSGGLGCDGNGMEKAGDIMNLKLRAIPRNHKLQIDVSLTLPESEYNQNLGMFQVRVEFFSAAGVTLASKSQPCMLKFQSEPIRILLTFLKIAPLVTGYITESQTLKLKVKGFTEGVVPTSCLKVVIEQRAEFQPGAGIPEIYDASLMLQSELPFLKRIIWCWRKTIFVWTSIMLFMIEFLFTLICCRPLVIPKTRPRVAASGSNTNGVLQRS